VSELLFRIENLAEARVIARVNRFVVKVAGEKEVFFLSLNNTGRLEDFLREGKRAFFVPHEHHKTQGKLIGVAEESSIALLDTALQMKAFEVAFSKNLFPWLSRWRSYRRNPRFLEATLDYLFVHGEEEAYLEMKSAVYRRENLALYPDAPTERGRRHLKTLIALRKKGFMTYVVFAVALPGVVGFAPFAERDRAIADLLKEAREVGVEIKAFLLSIDATGTVSLDVPDFPVLL
jgi:sugar fermentation stimulation protein A